MKHQVAFFLLLICFCYFSRLPARAEGPISCPLLVERALGAAPRPWRLVLRAGAKTSESLEAKGRVFTGLFFEVPLVDASVATRLRQHRREREKLLSALFEYQDLHRLRAFKEDLVRYHRQRLEMALEDNQPFLEAKEEVLKIESRFHAAEAVLRAYGISPKEALSCRW